MASKLDVYLITLSKSAGTFKDVISKKCDLTSQTTSPTKVFNAFYKCFLEQIGKNVFCVESKNMGITILKGQGQRLNTIVTAHSSSYVIEGFIDGGSYNSIRKIASLTDLSKRQKIKKSDIVTDSFYFYLYLPLDSKIGIFMVQTKENSSIRRVVPRFWELLLKTDEHKNCRINMYYPKWLRDEFLNGANLHSLSFENESISQVQSEEEMTVNSQSYKVKVIITPNEENSITDLSSLIERIGNDFAIKVGTATHTLSSFAKKKGSVKNDEKKKTLPFTIDEEDKIHPVINLDDELFSDANGDFEREDLKAFCDDLLKKIKQEIYAIQR